MLHLQDLAKQGTHVTTLIIKDRLPDFLSAPCNLKISYRVEANDDHYLLHLNVSGDLHVTCQRCMHEFDYPYDNHTIVAVCRTDERAEKLLEHYECIVSIDGEIDLEDVVIDELHLYAPEFHPNIQDCDSLINQMLHEKNEN